MLAGARLTARFGAGAGWVGAAGYTSHGSLVPGCACSLLLTWIVFPMPYLNRGDNAYGQLGNGLSGSNQYSSVPSRVLDPATYYYLSPPPPPSPPPPLLNPFGRPRGPNVNGSNAGSTSSGSTGSAGSTSSSSNSTAFGGWIEVSAGYLHSCAVAVQGQAGYCWGAADRIGLALTNATGIITQVRRGWLGSCWACVVMLGGAGVAQLQPHGWRALAHARLTALPSPPLPLATHPVQPQLLTGVPDARWLHIQARLCLEGAGEGCCCAPLLPPPLLPRRLPALALRRPANDRRLAGQAGNPDTCGITLEGAMICGSLSPATFAGER